MCNICLIIQLLALRGIYAEWYGNRKRTAKCRPFKHYLLTINNFSITENLIVGFPVDIVKVIIFVCGCSDAIDRVKPRLSVSPRGIASYTVTFFSPAIRHSRIFCIAVSDNYEVGKL